MLIMISFLILVRFYFFVASLSKPRESLTVQLSVFYFQRLEWFRSSQIHLLSKEYLIHCYQCLFQKTFEIQYLLLKINLTHFLIAHNTASNPIVCGSVPKNFSVCYFFSLEQSMYTLINTHFPFPMTNRSTASHSFAHEINSIF